MPDLTYVDEEIEGSNQVASNHDAEREQANEDYTTKNIALQIVTCEREIPFCWNKEEKISCRLCMRRSRMKS